MEMLDYPRSVAAARDSAFVREATRLAADGELGNSDAIRLLQIPHRPEDVHDVLRTFQTQLSREAKSKLTLDAMVPLPDGVDNQRFEPLFDKYILTGRTYKTASGAVVPAELLYFNGQMVHLYGECTNVSAVSDALAGSGYQPILAKHADGRETAFAQLWANQFTDSTLGPYSAMFMVVPAVRSDALPTHASIKVDEDGASSVLPMLTGSFDERTSVYENAPRLFLVRLLDTTRVAIDVGRERMGTDKRPGTVDVTRDGRRIRVAIADQSGRGVVRANLELANDPAAFLPEVARAAATAGVALPILPASTEYSYPAVARIGRGPIVSWQWRSDRPLRLQGVAPGSVVLDSSSEEGRILTTWNFKPQVLGFTPNVRGVVTGLSDAPEYGASQPSAPVQTGHRPAIVGTADRRGEPAAAYATRALRPFGVDADSLAALQSLFTGNQSPTVHAPSPLALVTPGSLRQSNKSDSARPAGQPRWAWNPVFLGCLTATLRKEPVGVTPDGLRIDWYVKEGSFVGPQFQLVCLPGAADWMRIRADGIGVVNVQACFETPTGSRIYGTYGGVFDLGPDGFARAQREEFDPLPPVVVVPTYATADPALAWLNRAQCLGVGRVDMAALRVEFDVYVVRVGGAIQPAQNDAAGNGQSAAQSGSLYTRLGGYDQIAAITDDFVAAIVADKQLGRLFVSGFPESRLRTIRQHVVDMLCELTGGPCVYTGRDMVTTHKGLGITNSDWDISVNLLKATLNRYRVGAREQSELLRIIGDMKGQIVEKM